MNKDNMGGSSNPKKPIVITDLADMSKDTILDEVALSEVLQKSPRTIRRMIRRGELPPPLRMGNRCYWFVGMVLNFFTDRARILQVEAEKKEMELQRIRAKMQSRIK